MFDYLEKLRLQPGHIRERIAFGAAGVTTAVVAAGWFAVVATSGTFVLGPSTFAEASGSKQLNTAFAQTSSGISSLLGAAAAFKSGDANGSSASGITVETEASTTVDKGMPTVLPF